MVPICMDFWKHSVVTPTLTNPNFCYPTMLSSHGIHVCIWRLEVNIKWPPQQLLHFWRQCFLLYLELSDWLLWFGQGALKSTCLYHTMPSTGLQMDTTCIPQLYVGSGDLNSDPHMYFMDWRKKKNYIAKNDLEFYILLPPPPWQLHLHK